MHRPSRESFDELAKRGNWIPVVREIRADLDTALSLFKRLDDGETSFLFESVAGAEKWARYSFMGRGARAIFRTRGQTVEWTESGQIQNFEIEGDPSSICATSWPQSMRRFQRRTAICRHSWVVRSGS